MDKINKTILLLEDNELINLQTKKFLETLFLNSVDSCKTADEALIRFMDKSYDLIICDIKVPGELNGLSFIEEAKKINPNIKSIIISAYADKKTILKSKELEVNSFIEKPYKLQTLVMALVDLNFNEDNGQLEKLLNNF